MFDEAQALIAFVALIVLVVFVFLGLPALASWQQRRRQRRGHW